MSQNQQSESRMLRVADVAGMLNVNRMTVSRLFKHEEGVLHLARPATRYKRAYTTLLIPEAVYARVYQRLKQSNVR